MEPFHSGTLAGIGSFQCKTCDYVVSLAAEDTLPECPGCGGKEFVRASLFSAPGFAGEAPRDATGLPDGFGAVVTGIRSAYPRPVEAGQPFTVRVRRLPSGIEPTARVAEFHLIEYELTDVDGEVAAFLWLTVAEFRP